jgi:hypothetical protein
VGEETPYRQTVAAGRAALALLKEGLAAQKLRLSRKELQWLDRMEASLDELPGDEASLIAALEEQYGALYDKPSYGL